MVAVLNWTASSSASLTASATGLAGTASVSIEINRAKDFASDDSMFITGTKTSGADSYATTIYGLPSGTTFFGRIRNDTTGERSAAALRSTAAVAVSSTYTGYSIDKSLLVVPVDLIGLTVASDDYTAVSGFPVSNLTRDDPSSTFQCRKNTPNDVAGQQQIYFETSGEPINTIALLGLNVNDNETWQIQSRPDLATGFGAAGSVLYAAQTLRASPTIGRRASYHAIYNLPAPSTHKYWVIQLFIRTPHLIVRNLVVGRARSSTNADKGAGYGVNDLGSATRTRFGVLDSVRGWRGKVVDFSMSWISETEFQAKWADLPGLVGTTKAVLAIPNSKRNIHLNDRIAFGNITQMRGENVQSFKYSQTIEINSIY